MKKALLIVDMLNDFIRSNGSLYIEGSQKIIPRIKEEIKKARRENIPVVYLCDSHNKNDPEFKIWPEHCVTGTEGAMIIDELKPDKNDIIIRKTTYSGFFNTNLYKTLKNQKIDYLIITGVATNICVLYTAADARMRDYQVEIKKDAVWGLTTDEKKWALKQMDRVLLARIN